MLFAIYVALSVVFNMEAPEAGIVLLPYLTPRQEVTIEVT